MISTGGTFTAFFDANVLFSPLVTDLILELAVANIYRPKWSQKSTMSGSAQCCEHVQMPTKLRCGVVAR